MQNVVYDTGALLAAERGSEKLANLHRRFIADSVAPLIPVVVLAQAWRGGPQPRLSMLLKGCEILPDNERCGRAAGVACARNETSDVVDALVVVTAVERNAAIVTSDPGDLKRLADAIGVKLRLFSI